MPELFDQALIDTLHIDQKYLKTTDIPIITISASFKEDLKRLHGLKDNDTIPDVVFSRAHYSMALAVAIEAWKNKLNPAKAWIVDPTNYVAEKDWGSITFTENIGKLLARNSFLKKIKDFIDTFLRGKLPIIKSITPPLLYLTKGLEKPILSMHIAAGNILLGLGKKVVQVVTDPHVRQEYVKFAGHKNASFCVFDEKTKLEFLEKAQLLGIKADPNRVIVTGPPVDPRIIETRFKKQPWRSGILNLCMTTGGLGTNKAEILAILSQLLKELKKKDSKIRLLLYAGTHKDIHDEAIQMAEKEKVYSEKLHKSSAKFRVIYHPQIVDANELLIKYAFSFADGFITKPSGDMAYDVAASGSFLLTLQEWGEWEENIREVFEQKGIARKAMTENILGQLEVLKQAKLRSNSWVENAMCRALSIDPLFLNGTKNIIKAYKNLH